MKNIESKIQSQCVAWFRMQYPKLVLFAIPNGGKRNVITATIMKREGVLKGVPDLFLAKPSGQYCGLFIEMKKPRGALTKDQKNIHATLLVEGYGVIICRSLDEFIFWVNEYLQVNSHNWT